MTTAPTGGPERRPWLAGFAALNALSAWGGAIGLAVGAVDFGPAINDRLPFDSLVLAALALASIVALPLSVLAWSAWTGGPRTGDLALAAGVLLCGWIVGQVVVIRSFSFFQPVYLAIGGAFVAASHRVHLGPRRRGALFVVGGSILAAVGVGLVPHVIKVGLAAWSVVSIVLLLAGITAVVVGAWSALRGGSLPARVGGAVATLAAVLVAVSVVAPAVAATAVPDTVVTTTPAAHGLTYESVTVTTADGVDLAAWYVPGTNGAGVVVAHGAGSTRSSVLDEAAVLARAGYALVLVDARGHGDSGGTAMDFGWYGDLDLTAATAYLAARPDVDADRIGVVGFSMGGEQAVGAAAADARIRAVVAEGATARQAADKAWLSDVYGWRGWVQEQLERVQYGVADYLTEASPPTVLRDAVAKAQDAQFLLIAAGTMDDEEHAASFIREGASDRVAVWTVAGAAPAGGYEAQPDAWERRVVGFLDANLG